MALGVCDTGDDRLCDSARDAAWRRRRRSSASTTPGVLQRDGWQSYRLFQTAAASDVSRASAAPLSGAAARLSGAAVRHGRESDPAGGAGDARRLSRWRRVRARPRDRARPLHRAARPPAASARRVAALRVRRFQQHLIVEFDAIFSFLFDPTLDATNWRAEHALRPAVVTRKMCGGGNRTARGADSQQVLTSVLRTADQRGLDATDVLVTLLTARTPIVPPSLRTIPAIHSLQLPTSNSQPPRANSTWALGVGSALGVGNWRLGA